MKLINIYLVGLFYVLKPTKYMVWNNEIISWRLGLLCMDAIAYPAGGGILLLLVA